MILRLASQIAALLHRLPMLLMATAVAIMPVALDPVNSTPDPAVDSKELMLRLVVAFWALSLAAAALVRCTPIAAAFNPRNWSPGDWGIWVWSIVHVVSAIFSGRFVYCVVVSWPYALLPILAWITARTASRPNAGTIIAAATFGGLLASLYGFLTYIGKDPLQAIYPFRYSTEDARNFVHSFLGNPEYFGSLMAGLSAMLLVLGITTARRTTRLVTLGIGCWFGLMVVLSGTRGAFIGLGAAMALGLLPYWRSLNEPQRLLGRRMVYAAMGALALLVMVFSTPNPVNRRELRLAQRFVEAFDFSSASVKERLLFFTLASRIASEHPILGSGPGTFRIEFYPQLNALDAEDDGATVRRLAYTVRDRIAAHVHSEYLEAWADLGAVGFGALLLIVVSLGVRQALAPAGQPATFHAAFAGAFCLFINGVFSFPLHMPERAVLVWSLLALYLVAVQKEKAVDTNPTGQVSTAATPVA